MILYFSGSGNNKFIANYLKDLIKDEIISLNEVLKENKPLEFNSTKPFVIISPIYAWRYPLLIEDLIKKASFKGNNKIYFIASMGLNCGNADKYLKNIIANKNMEYMGFAKVIMPSNYVVSEKAPTKEKAKNIIKKSLPILDSIANLIIRNKKFIQNKKEHFGYFYSTIANYGFNKFYKTSKNFIVDDSCVKCQTCIKVCPLNNIKMINDKITFSTNCMFCLSCMNNCPVNAITYKGHKNGTYICPHRKDTK